MSRRAACARSLASDLRVRGFTLAWEFLSRARTKLSCDFFSLYLFTPLCGRRKLGLGTPE